MIWKKLNYLVSLQNEVKQLRLQDKFCKQKIPEIVKKVFELVTDIAENISKGDTSYDENL